VSVEDAATTKATTDDLCIERGRCGSYSLDFTL
jgi:hypothetical protein